jgi:hypothetical protein
LVTVGKDVPGCKSDLKQNLKELVSQGTRYAKLFEERKNPLGKDRSGFGGKINGEQDDLWNTFMWLIYFPALFMTKARYAMDRASTMVPQVAAVAA